MTKIGILGCRGIPNRYGGFEQFAEKLGPALVNKGLEVYVYNSHRHPCKDAEWKGVKRILCYDPEHLIGQAGQFVYDWNCIRDSRKRQFDVILLLGYTSSSVWHWHLPRKATIITNMDGLEWKRSKYPGVVRKFLKYAEKLAVRNSHALVADSTVIQQYLKDEYGVASTYIPYGADIYVPPGQVDSRNTDSDSKSLTDETSADSEESNGSNDVISGNSQDARSRTGDTRNYTSGSRTLTDAAGTDSLDAESFADPGRADSQDAKSLTDETSFYLQDPNSSNDVSSGYSQDVGGPTNETSIAFLSELDLEPRAYYLLIARMQADNHIEEILEGYRKATPRFPILVVGSLGGRYARMLRKKFRDEQIRFLSGIFEPEKLDVLRHYCRLYFHGHSSGGTNPSLLEAMAASVPICAHDNPFNREVLRDHALYFSSPRDVSQHIHAGISDETRARFIRANKERIRKDYAWEEVINAYLQLINNR